ncbi:MAG TPA: hypothetical protein VGR90_04405, partial [Acidimicrobiales bacterium]|nr:hypothetical protein [Acidimicrobiales bacterium]
ETDTSQWERVISSVRHSFSGSLAYEENWDVVGRARFLGDVDLIGVSSYFPLDDSPAPTLAQLRADWSNSHASATYGSNWVAVLDQLAASTHKPIVFGEAGYMSGDYAAKQPFLNFEGQPDWQLQSDLYQALLETFSAKPWWSGAVWWEWGNPDGAIPDAGRSPGGKTAELLLQRWYAQGQRPANPDTPLVLAGGPGSSGGGISAAGVGTPVGATGAVSAGAGSTAAGRSAARAGLDAAQRAGLMAVVALLIALGTACWFTLGRAPTRSAPAAFATYRPPRRARGR